VSDGERARIAITRRKAEAAALRVEARSTLDKCRVEDNLYCLSRGGALPIKIRVLALMAHMAKPAAVVCGQRDCDEHRKKEANP